MPDNKFTKANVTKDTIKIINKIAAEEDKYIYTIIEEAIREAHPEYFKNNVKAKEEIKTLNC